MITGETNPERTGRSLVKAGPLAAIVKLGANGSLFVTRSDATYYPPVSVDVVDTTCAGDSFAAGFVYGLSCGWDRDHAMRFANAAGALSTTRISRQAIRSVEDVDRLLAASRVAQTI